MSEQNQTFFLSPWDLASYTGPIPSPLPVLWKVPESDFDSRVSIVRPSDLRTWIRNAAEYHDVPLEIMCTILQQENVPSSDWFHKLGQFGERSIQTLAHILNNYADGCVPDTVAFGSSGIMNMLKKTLDKTIVYNDSIYGKPIIPDSVRFRGNGLDADTRIAGYDWKADLYYGAAHLRQLIDQVKGIPKFHGELTEDDVFNIFTKYNGSTDYGNRAIKTLKNAINGQEHLYFYERND